VFVSLLSLSCSLCPLEMQFWVEFPTQSTWLEVLTKAVSVGSLRKVSLRLKANMYFFFVINISVDLKLCFGLAL